MFHQASGADDHGFFMLSTDADFAIGVIENRQGQVAVNVHPQHLLIEGAIQGIEKGIPRSLSRISCTVKPRITR